MGRRRPRHGLGRFPRAHLEHGRAGGKVKVNIKKFLQVLYLEVQEQLRD